ncbi:DNA repair protein RadC [Macrococcus capreoli]|uniref:RadC family protein n=1 Tax=Macrococcus capreoli TaxID=2982690 RepID=UPI0021D5CEA5|nr:DNA repair protein RadC [Macrococcus sp. TMW 2.2395]MCU7557135.1 DNA repair protein RadC [Macrococcus sp. TMW 2.2395]
MIDFALDIDKPRERLMIYGPDKLTNQELLSLIIGSGVRDETVYQVSDNILNQVDSIKDLRYLTIQELTQIKGIGDKKAATILAVVELAQRMHTHSPEEKVRITSPQSVSDLLMERMRYLTQEHFMILMLNTKNYVIHEHTVFIGSLNASIVHPREIFREAIKRSAANIIAVHNHPSGCAEPSYEDIEVTRRLVNVGELVGIDLLDHIIIGDGEFTSLKERRKL